MTGQRVAAVAADLRERIALGDVAPSGALESEAALGLRHEVSRVTVRRALELLRSEGLVESRRGAGWFVAGASVHQPLALGTFRHAGSAVADAGLRASRRVVGFGFRPAPDRVAASLQLGEGDDVLHVRSVRSVDGVPLDVAHEWVPGALGGAVSRSAAQDPGTWATLQGHGVRIDRVRQTVTAAVATDDDADLLGVAAGSALLLVRRVAHDAAGGPVALADHRYLASRFSLEMEFAGWSAAGAGEPPGLRDSAAGGRTTTATRTGTATATRTGTATPTATSPVTGTAARTAARTTARTAARTPAKTGIATATRNATPMTTEEETR